MKNKLFLLFFALVLFGACENNKMPVKEISEIPDQAIEKFTVTETQSGKRHWIIEAPSAKIFEDQKKAYLTSPIIQFFDKGKYVSTLTADKGTVDLGTYDMIGEGTCTVKSFKGDDLETSNLRYFSGAQKIVTDEKVKLIREGNTVYGTGMEATPDLQTITIKNQTTEIKR